MAVAGGLNLCSPRLVRNIDLDLIWHSCLVSRRGPDIHCSKRPRIPPIHQRLWKLSSSLNGPSDCVPTRRRPLSPPGAQVQEDILEIIDPEEFKKSVLEVSTTQIDKEIATLERAPDLSFLHVLPHVVTAATANFMFGYHIGIVNGPLQSIAKELKFDGDTMVEGFVVSTFIVGAFVGSIIGGVLSDTIGRRRTFQICAIPLVIGAAIRRCQVFPVLLAAEGSRVFAVLADAFQEQHWKFGHNVAPVNTDVYSQDERF